MFDHASPIGELIVAAPTYFRLDARFHGAAAHAGIRPEDGRNAIAAAARAIAAMRIGRIDEQTTANVGTIEGGSAGNVVAERCRVELEARSLDDDKAGRVIGEMVDACSEAAERPRVRRGDDRGAALPRLPPARAQRRRCRPHRRPWSRWGSSRST